ncbi:MAG TPA: histidine phosphatase family protein [Gaiella sp.]|jgi:phosphohistidine phosphatase SixA
MRIHLCRHAEAYPGEPDELRELTNAGRRGARMLGERLAQLEDPPRVVVTSPLTRARQTAEPVAERLGCDVLVREQLAPGATADSLRSAVAGLDGPVAAVCHQPDCSGIMLAVTGDDPGFQVGESFPLELDA